METDYLINHEDNVTVLGGEAPKPRITPQVIATLIVCLAPLSAGFTLGFSSPTLHELESTGVLTGDQISLYSSLLTIGAIFGGPVAGFVMEKLGRKPTLMLGNVIFCAGWIALAAANNYIVLYIGRILTGTACGMSTVATPTYISEIATKQLRGTLGTAFQLFVTIGILVVYSLGMILNRKWLADACVFIPGVMSLALLAIPETPRWLISRHQRDQGLKALRWLRGTEYEIEEECLEIEANLETQRSQRSSWKQMCTSPSLIKPLFVSICLMVFQQGTGINCVIFNASAIFKNAGFENDPHTPSVIIGAVQVAATFVACILMDLAGRRVLLIAAGVVMTISHCGIGLFYYLYEEKDMTNLSWLSLVSLIVFICAFSLGWGPIPWLIMSEIFPSHARGFASAVASAINWTCAFIITQQFNNLQDAIHNYGAFWFFGGFCFLSVIFVAIFVPETKGKTLEEIQEHFSGESTQET